MSRDRIPLWWLAAMGAMAGAVVWSIIWTVVLMVR